MPLYEVSHISPLTGEQKNELAKEITRIHATKFMAPSIFVNVVFNDVRGQDAYVGGELRPSNRIVGNVRHGPSRTQADYDDVSSSIQRAWEIIVSGENIRAILIVGTVLGGIEAGFAIPPVGTDMQWLKENKQSFATAANEGNQEMQDLMKELKTREEFAGIL